MEHIVFSFTAGPWWAYLLLVGAAFLVATISYQRTVPELPSGMRAFLILLRTLGMSLLLIALFEPVLRIVRSTEYQPSVVIAVDESRSVVTGSTSAERRDQVLSTIDRIRSVFADAEVVGFAGSARPLPELDSIRFDGERTDPSSVLRFVANRPALERPALMVLLGDGNGNSGESPISTAEATGLGVYTVGIGNTKDVTDVAAQSLFTSGIVVVDRPTMVTGRFVASGLKGTPIEVVLEEEGKVIARDTVTPIAGQETVSAQFTWTPTTAGQRNVRVRAAAIQGEYRGNNNAVQDLIDVRSNKRTVVVFAGAPSPDVSFLTTLLQQDPTVVVKSFIQKQGGTFYGASPVPADLDGVEAIMMIGFPIASTPESLLGMITKRTSEGTSLLFIPSKDVDQTRLSRFEEVLPFKVAASRPTEFLVTPDIKPGATADPLLKITGAETDVDLWETVPPIYRTETFVTPTPGARTLASIRVNNVPMDEPLIMTRESGRSRSMAILGYGIYRWKLLGEGPQAARGERPIPIFETFFSNVVSWLAVEEDERRIRIRSTQRLYAAGENVGFEASILDQTFAPIDGASVTVTINTPNGKRTLVLAGIGGGRYAGSIGALPAGSYTYDGVAVVNGQKIGSDNGRFLVGDLGLEDAALTVNTAALASLAERSGARYAPVSDIDSLLQAMRTDPRLAPRAVTTERDTTLWHTIWPILAAIAAFATEWFLRKRRGLV